MCVVSGISLLTGAVPANLNAAVLIVLGICLMIVACSVGRVEKNAPDIIPWTDNDGAHVSKYWILNKADLSTKNMFTLQGGFTVLMIAVIALMGAMGIVSYAMGISISIFMFNLALQIMISGDTPIGEFRVNWVLIILSMTIAVMVMLSCAVPGILTDAFAYALGIENIVMGVFGLHHMYVLDRKIRSMNPEKMPGVLKHILVTGCLLYLVVFPFGINMLVPNIMPSIVTLVIMVITGIMLIRMTFLMRKAGKMGIPVGTSKN